MEKIIYKLQSWQDARKIFASDLEKLEASKFGDADQTYVQLINQIADWNKQTYKRLNEIPDLNLSSRLFEISESVSLGLSLKQELDTNHVSEWLLSSEGDQKLKTQFGITRQILNDRLATLATIFTEAMIAADMKLPSQVGNTRALISNTRRFAVMLGGRPTLSVPAVAAGSIRIFWKQRRHVQNAIGMQIRSLRIGKFNSKSKVFRLNQTINEKMLDYSRAELLRSVYQNLERRGIYGVEAERVTAEILRIGSLNSTKAWKALVTARELMRNAGISPQDPDFFLQLESALTDDVHYTHTPGKEWVIRNYQIGKLLLQQDSKTRHDTGTIPLSQSGASIAPGAVASNQSLLNLASHYLKSVEVYQNSIVAQTGEDHRRHRRVFKDYFSKSRVMNESKFIEQTATKLVDQVANEASRNKGKFDFKQDLALKYPIKIICRFLGVPDKDSNKVQTWAIQLVRSLDAGAGLSLSVLKEGNQAAAEFYTYFSEMIKQAEDGSQVPGIIGSTALSKEQNRKELLANYVTLTFAGFETTTGLISMGMAELLNRRDQWEFLKSKLVDNSNSQNYLVDNSQFRWLVWADNERGGKLNNPEDITKFEKLKQQVESSPELSSRYKSFIEQETALGNAVEEMLRWTTPGSVIPLTLEEPYNIESPVNATMAGCPITAGDKLNFDKNQTIMVDLNAANRNGCPVNAGKFNESPHEFDITRPDNNKHLSFGVSHMCIGADLAVENSKRMIEAVARKFPNLELDGQPIESDGQLFFTFDKLPVKTN